MRTRRGIRFILTFCGQICKSVKVFPIVDCIFFDAKFRQFGKKSSILVTNLQFDTAKTYNWQWSWQLHCVRILAEGFSWVLHFQAILRIETYVSGSIVTMYERSKHPIAGSLSCPPIALSGYSEFVIKVSSARFSTDFRQISASFFMIGMLYKHRSLVILERPILFGLHITNAFLTRYPKKQSTHQ